jgi:hypothetical protein
VLSHEDEGRDRAGGITITVVFRPEATVAQVGHCSGHSDNAHLSLSSLSE